jgi:hypothetical protein
MQVPITACLYDFHFLPYKYILPYVYGTYNYHQTGSYNCKSVTVTYSFMIKAYCTVCMWLTIITLQFYITVCLCDV